MMLKMPSTTLSLLCIIVRLYSKIRTPPLSISP